MPNGVASATHEPQVILDVAWRQADQQSANLESCKRQALLIPGAYFGTGTLSMAALAAAVAAGDTTLDFALTIRVAVIVLAWSLGLSLITVLVHFLAQRWEGVFSIEEMINGYGSLAGRNRILELDIAATLEHHYKKNKMRLYRIRWWLVIQVFAAAVGVVVLIRSLFSLT